MPGLQDALALGLTKAEYELVCEKQGGPPNAVELAMYSLLWSEHCAYKHSKKLLRTLPTHSAHVVMGPGENAGAVDLGGGLVCAFKVESHNHPSAVEPFQGAATGVGGILRDIFAIGARPIAVLDSLRFGEPTAATSLAGAAGEPDDDGGQAAAADAQARAARTRYLLDAAVSGIAHYGNSVGVPTVGGEVYFEGPYAQNCLVNAMALGIAPRERLMRSAAAGPGNVLVLFGAATGRDGIGGASVLASTELGEAEDGKRPTVQVGDPFEGKKLLECSLDLLDQGLLVSLQDLGAAGLTSAASEMAAKGGVGLDIDVARVPLREDDMEPFEVMVSESQERMLCVVTPDRVQDVLTVCDRWEVHGAVIGAVTDSGRMRVLRHCELGAGGLQGGELLGEMPVAALVDECPLYDLQPQPPAASIYPPPPPLLSADASPRECLLALLGSPNIASRLPLYAHYDPVVQSRTVRRPGSADAAVLAIEPLTGHPPESGEPLPGIAVSIDCNGRRVAADPYRGTVEAVLECAANLACVGAEPLGVTNNLNFGNPEKPHIAWQLEACVTGLGDACRALGVAIVGGNVSLYNEGASGPIYPTPVIGMVGAVPDMRRACQLGFAREGDAIALVGPFAPDHAASELSKLYGEPLPEGLRAIEAAEVIAAITKVADAVRSGGLSSAHDIAEGGIAVALAECCLAGGIGATVAIAPEVGDGTEGAHDAERASRLLFGEGPGGFLLSGPEKALRDLAAKVSVTLIGRVGGERLLIDAGAAAIDVTLIEMEAAHRSLAELFR